MNKLNFAFLAVCIFLSSCHSLVDDEFPNYEPVPVLNGLLQADSTFKVQVSLTANLTDTAPIYVSNALVVIESSEDATDTLVYTQKGWYVSPRTVKTGVSYTCSAEIPGYTTMTAHTTVPVPTEIDSIAYIDLAGRDEEGNKISSIQFCISNNVNTENFWEVQLKVKGIGREYNWETKESIEGLIVRDKYFYMKAEQDSVLLNEANPLELFSNSKIINDQYWVRTYYNENYGPIIGENDTLIIELHTVDKSYYRYEKQFYIYESAQYPSIGQSAQKYSLFSNVKNGLGLFTGMSITRNEIASKKLTPYL